MNTSDDYTKKLEAIQDEAETRRQAEWKTSPLNSENPASPLHPGHPANPMNPLNPLSPFNINNLLR